MKKDIICIRLVTNRQKVTKNQKNVKIVSKRNKDTLNGLKFMSYGYAMSVMRFLLEAKHMRVILLLDT